MNYVYEILNGYTLDLAEIEFRFHVSGMGNNSYGLAFFIDGVQIMPAPGVPYISNQPDFTVFQTQIDSPGLFYFRISSLL